MRRVIFCFVFSGETATKLRADQQPALTYKLNRPVVQQHRHPRAARVPFSYVSSAARDSPTHLVRRPVIESRDNDIARRASANRGSLLRKQNVFVNSDPRAETPGVILLLQLSPAPPSSPSVQRRG